MRIVHTIDELQELIDRNNRAMTDSWICTNNGFFT